MNWKTILLGLITLICALFYGWFAKTVFNSTLGVWQTFVYITLATIVLLGFWGLFIYLIQNIWVGIFSALFIPAIIITFLPKNYPYLTAISLLVIIAIYIYFQISSDRKNRLKIALDQSLSPGLKTLFWALAIIVSLVFFFSPKAHIYDSGIKIPYAYEVRMLTMLIPGFRTDYTLDEMILFFSLKPTNVDDTLGFIRKNLAEMPPAQMDTIRSQTLNQWGLDDLNLNGSEKISSNPKIIETLMGNQLQTIWEKIVPFLPLILAFGIFEIAILMGYIIVPLAIFFAYSLYQLMIALNLVKIDIVSTEKEVLKL